MVDKENCVSATSADGCRFALTQACAEHVDAFDHFGFDLEKSKSERQRAETSVGGDAMSDDAFGCLSTFSLPPPQFQSTPLVSRQNAVNEKETSLIETTAENLLPETSLLDNLNETPRANQLSKSSALFSITDGFNSPAIGACLETPTGQFDPAFLRYLNDSVASGKETPRQQRYVSLLNKEKATPVEQTKKNDTEKTTSANIFNDVLDGFLAQPSSAFGKSRDSTIVAGAPDLFSSALTTNSENWKDDSRELANLAREERRSRNEKVSSSTFSSNTFESCSSYNRTQFAVNPQSLPGATGVMCGPFVQIQSKRLLGFHYWYDCRSGESLAKLPPLGKRCFVPENGGDQRQHILSAFPDETCLAIWNESYQNELREFTHVRGNAESSTDCIVSGASSQILSRFHAECSEQNLSYSNDSINILSLPDTFIEQQNSTESDADERRSSSPILALSKVPLPNSNVQPQQKLDVITARTQAAATQTHPRFVAARKSPAHLPPGHSRRFLRERGFEVSPTPKKRRRRMSYPSFGVLKKKRQTLSSVRSSNDDDKKCCSKSKRRRRTLPHQTSLPCLAVTTRAKWAKQNSFDANHTINDFNKENVNSRNQSATDEKIILSSFTDSSGLKLRINVHRMPRVDVLLETESSWPALIARENRRCRERERKIAESGADSTTIAKKSEEHGIENC